VNRTASLVSSVECRHYLKSQVRVTEALPLRSIDCRVLTYTALRQVTYSEVTEMWETFFVCKPVCQWSGIRVSFSDGLLVGCNFLKDIYAISAWYVDREITESQCFGLLGIEQSDCLHERTPVLVVQNVRFVDPSRQN